MNLSERSKSMDNGASSYRRFLDGDDKGLAEIVRDYRDGLILYLNGIVNNISVAEELMEETFFKIITKKPRDLCCTGHIFKISKELFAKYNRFI